MRALTVAVTDAGLRSDLVSTVRAAGYDAEDVPAARLLDRVRSGNSRFVLLDVAVQSDLELVSKLRAEAPALDIVALGANPSPQLIVDARRRGVRDFLRKPFDLSALEQVLAVAGPGIESAGDSPAFGTRDPDLEQLLVSLGRAAVTDAAIQLQGESGTGKDLLARWIHRHSRRRCGPFVVVTCAGLSETLAERELFGHHDETGDGAFESRAGQLKASSGGTLVLDEVCDLELRLQAKLLRVLQEGMVVPVGSHEAHPVDLRVVAVTQRELAQEVEAGRFRADLYYSLSVIEFRIPPLRERRGDIGLLARALLERYAREQGSELARLGERALSALEAHPFKGNVRELENLMRRASFLFAGRDIDPDVLLSAKPAAPALESMLRPLNLKELEREAIQRSLATSGGNRTRASLALGISVRTLRNKIREYGLS